MTRLVLPVEGGDLETFRMRAPRWRSPVAGRPPRSRQVFAAAHVVVDARTTTGVAAPAIDWDATLAFRHSVWDLGLGVADAMDTAQRGTGLPPSAVRELVERSARDAAGRGAALVCGACTDDVVADPAATLAEIEESYLRQCEWIEGAGSQVVIMASPALASSARSAEDYLKVYSRVLSSLDRPAILHWLGGAFDPRLAGYWGSTDLDEAAESVLALVEENAATIDGIKVSLLDAAREIDLRRRLPDGVRVYTGDDLHYPDLIKGDDQGHSDALLGIFDAIAPLAAAAMERLDAGDEAGFDVLLAPTVELSAKVFEPPTYRYKTGIVFLAYVRGLQDHFVMLGGQQSARSITHLADVFRLADAAGLFADPELAANRFRPVLEAAGVPQGGAA